MGVLPVPEVVKDMAFALDKMAKTLEDVARKTDLLHSEFNEIKSSVQAVGAFGSRLDALQGEMRAMKESVKVVTDYIERK
jgi:phage-related protein